MRLKQQQGEKTHSRDIRDPKQEAIDATYFTSSGEYGIPVSALKNSIISAAHKDIGIEKTLVRKALFIKCDDLGGILRMECKPPVMREDSVRVGAGLADLRYRPIFTAWSAIIHFEIDADL